MTPFKLARLVGKEYEGALGQSHPHMFTPAYMGATMKALKASKLRTGLEYVALAVVVLWYYRIGPGREPKTWDPETITNEGNMRRYGKWRTRLHERGLTPEEVLRQAGPGGRNAPRRASEAEKGAIRSL